MPEILGLALPTVLACLAIVYLGAVMQATTGVGVGILSSPVLVLADPSFVPAVIVLGVLPLSMSVAWADRLHVETRDVVAALVGRVPGLILGAMVVAAITDDVLAYLVATTVLLGVAASLTSKRFTPTRPALMVAGFGSGFFGTAVGVGGPPIALTYQHADPVTMRATISAFFSIGSFLSVVALAVAGEYGRHEIALVLLLAPALGLGWWTARRLRHRLSGPLVRPMVLGLSAFSALALLVRTIAS